MSVLTVLFIIGMGFSGRVIGQTTYSYPDPSYNHGISSPPINGQSINTGMDMMETANGKQISVVVWDGDDPGITVRGDFFNSSADRTIYFKNLSSTTYGHLYFLHDPDVALYKASNQEYIAVVVGIDAKDLNLVTYNAFRIFCGGEGQQIAHSQIEPIEPRCNRKHFGNALPNGVNISANPVNLMGLYNNDGERMLYRKCFTPNIDINSAGKIIVSWSEEALVTTSVTLESDFMTRVGLSAPLSLPYRIGNVMYLQGDVKSDQCDFWGDQTPCSNITPDIDNKFYDNSATLIQFSFAGPSSQHGSVKPTFTGRPVGTLQELTSDFYAFGRSDVSISEGSDPVITWAFMRYKNTPGRLPESPRLVTVQKLFSDCGFDSNGDWLNTIIGTEVRKDDWQPVYGDVPRVASTNASDPSKTDFRDYVVTLSYSGTGYDCATETVFTGSAIGLYSYVKGNDFSNNGISGVRKANTVAPYDEWISGPSAIAYNSANNHVAVVWRAVEPDPSNIGRILAKSFEFNATTSLLDELGTTGISEVSSNHTEQTYAPSVASRWTSGERTYSYYQDVTGHNNILSRTTDDIAGAAALGSVATTYFGMCEPSTPEPIINGRQGAIFPNPVHSGQVLEVKTEGVTGVKLYNTFGKLVFDATLNKGKAIKALPTLPKGYYTAHLHTEKGTTTTSVVIE